MIYFQMFLTFLHAIVILYKESFKFLRNLIKNEENCQEVMSILSENDGSKHSTPNCEI